MENFTVWNHCTDAHHGHLFHFLPLLLTAESTSVYSPAVNQSQTLLPGEWEVFFF